MICRVGNKEDWDLLEQKMLQSWIQETEQVPIESSVKREGVSSSVDSQFPQDSSQVIDKNVDFK